MRNLCGTIFYVKTNVLQDFHICMSVPLNSIITCDKQLCRTATNALRQKLLHALSLTAERYKFMRQLLLSIAFNPFSTNVLLLYPLKTSGNLLPEVEHWLKMRYCQYNTFNNTFNIIHLIFLHLI